MAIINLIPEMTSNTTPSGVASAVSGSSSAWQSMDRNNSTKWTGDEGDYTGWLQYQFSTSQSCNSYSITPDSSATSSAPKDWTVECSNTGAFSGEETILDTQSNITSWTVSTKKEFTFSNSTSYTYYRIVITDTSGGAYNPIISELELGTENIPPQSIATLEITASAIPHRYPKATAELELTATAVGTGGKPIATANITLTATAQPIYYVPKASSNMEVTATARAYSTIADENMFTFAYTIQNAREESGFKFIYSIEQPKTATIIKRVNL